MQMPRLLARARTYVIRGGRMSASGRRALAELLPRYAATAADWQAKEGRPLEVEIGCGKGESILHYAQARPHSLQIAFEVYPPAVASLLARLHEAGLTNVRVLMQDATVRLPELGAAKSLAAIRTLYPDPWPKKRHRKRRLLDAGFLLLAKKLLAPGGEFMFATDWREYYEQVVELAGAGNWEIAAAGPSSAVRGRRPKTRFERRAEQEGRASFDLRLRA